MNYKGYEGIIQLDEAGGFFHGDVINTRDVITFQGRSVEELRRALKDSVEDYLELCSSRGEEPEKPFSGKMLVRMSPELHRHISLEARRVGKSVNAYIVDRLKASALAADCG
jgi:predicted HicB family RNase H-like nuclease